MAGFLDSSIDMYKQQMQAVESMADGEEQLKSEGLMSSDDDQGIIADYTQRFVNYLRSKREEDRQAMLAERAAETAEAKKPLEITLEDVEQFQQEVDARKRVPEDEPFKYHVDHYTMQDIDTGVDSGDMQEARKVDVANIIKDAPSGIMSKPVADEVQPTDGKDADLNNYTNNFASIYLKNHEGTEDHKSHEDDTITKAYGVKYALGLKREDYDSDKQFAAAVALKHRDAAIKEFKGAGADWESLPQSVKYAIVDLHYNVGGMGTTASKKTQEDMLKNTLEYVLMTSAKESTKGTLISLAKRRAWNWNKATADTGLDKITRIEQIPTGKGTKFKYYDKNNNVIHEVTNKSTKPYKILNNGSLQLLTQTEEVTL